ncbi:MAG: polysaccharide biosynthesis/export family protein, partial [Bacteroidota bacterium]
MQFKSTIYYFILLVLASSCVTYESIVNYEDPQSHPIDSQQIDNYQPIRIQFNDVLYIRINSLEAAAEPFELNSGGGNIGAAAINPQALLINGYLVSQEGYIDFPTLGRIKLAGLTIEEAKASM